MLPMQTNPLDWWKLYGQFSYGIIKDCVKPTLCPALRCSLQGNRCLVPSTVLPSARISLLIPPSPSSTLMSPLIISSPLLPFSFAASLCVPIWINGLLRWLTWIVVVSLVRGISGILLSLFLPFSAFPRSRRRFWWIRTSFGRVCFRTGTHLTAVRAALWWKVVWLSSWSKDSWWCWGFWCPLGFSSLRSGIRTLGFFALFVWWLWRCVLQLRNV